MEKEKLTKALDKMQSAKKLARRNFAYADFREQTDVERLQSENKSLQEQNNYLLMAIHYMSVVTRQLSEKEIEALSALAIYDPEIEPEEYVDLVSAYNNQA